jgi:RNA polymerase sigma factor (sigma-70 family)
MGQLKTCRLPTSGGVFNGEMTDTNGLLWDYARNGSEEAFTEIVRRHVDFVYSVAVRKTGGDTHLAQDVTQTVFADLARKAKSMGKDVVLIGWLHRDTCFRAADMVRRERRRRAREQKAVEMQMLDKTGEDVWAQVAPLLDDAMDKLSESERDALLLRFIEGKSWRETGRALAVSEDAVQKRSGRALEKLRAILGRRGIVVSSAAITGLLAANSVQAAPAGLAASLTSTALAGLGGATTSLAEMLFMTTKTKIAIATVAAVTAVTAPIMWQHRANTQLREELTLARNENARLSGTGRSTSARVAAAVNNTPVNWQALESQDYRQYIANLRAAGCPEQTIRDIIITDLDRTYGKRIASIWGPAPATYWKAHDYVDGVKQHLEAKKIEEEKRAAIRELLGVDPDEETGRRTGTTVAYAEGFEFLSAEQRSQLREIERQAQAKIENLKLIRAGEFSPEYRGRQNEAYGWKDEQIKELMSPEQFKEYEIRTGRHASMLSNGLRYFNPTEEEFRTIYELEKQFGIDQSYGGGKAPEPANARQFQETLKQTLGEQRYADYELTKDSSYVILHDIARFHELPPETARAVYGMNKAAEQRAKAIRADGAVDAASREAALLALRKETEMDASNVLGEQAFQQYLFHFRDWLNRKIGMER